MIYFNTSCVKLSTVPRDKIGKSGIEQIRRRDMRTFCLKICNKYRKECYDAEQGKTGAGEKTQKYRQRPVFSQLSVLFRDHFRYFNHIARTHNEDHVALTGEFVRVRRCFLERVNY